MRKIIRILSFISMFCLMLILGYIICYIGYYGIKNINLTFILDKPKGIPVGTEGGVYPAIIGSLISTTIASAIAGIMGLCTAICGVYYIKNKRLKSILNIIVQCIAGIPSIVLGLFGYTFLVVNFGLGKSLISASITLSIMIFPFIEVRIEKALKEYSKDSILASKALGISIEYTLIKLIIPNCKREIFSSIAMAGGFAMGATAPIMLTGVVVNSNVPKSLTDPFMALPYNLYILMQQGIGSDKAYGTALVLVILILIINILGTILGGKRKNEYSNY